MPSFNTIPLFMVTRGVVAILWIVMVILVWRTAAAGESIADSLKCMVDKMGGGEGASRPAERR